MIETNSIQSRSKFNKEDKKFLIFLIFFAFILFSYLIFDFYKEEGRKEILKTFENSKYFNYIEYNNFNQIVPTDFTYYSIKGPTKCDGSVVEFDHIALNIDLYDKYNFKCLDTVICTFYLNKYFLKRKFIITDKVPDQENTNIVDVYLEQKHLDALNLLNINLKQIGRWKGTIQKNLRI